MAELLKKSGSELEQKRQFGPKSIQNLEEILNEDGFGLRWAVEIENPDPNAIIDDAHPEKVRIVDLLAVEKVHFRLPAWAQSISNILVNDQIYFMR